MIRNLTYRIPIREGADSIGLTRYLELEEGCDVSEEFLIETPRHSIGFIPVELAELRAAIDEMLRMADQHRDALTDGAGGQVAEADPPPPPDYLAILCSIACGCMLEHNTVTNGWKHMLGGKVSHGGCVLLLAKGLIESNGPMHSVGQPHVNGYLISAKGRARLAAQTPEAETKL